MNRTELRHITVHLRYLKRACNGGGIHPFDVESLWLMREQLVRTTALEMETEGLDFGEIMHAVHEIDGYLPVLIIGGDDS